MSATTGFPTPARHWLALITALVLGVLSISAVGDFGTPRTTCRDVKVYLTTPSGMRLMTPNDTYLTAPGSKRECKIIVGTVEIPWPAW